MIALLSLYLSLEVSVSECRWKSWHGPRHGGAHVHKAILCRLRAWRKTCCARSCFRCLMLCLSLLLLVSAALTTFGFSCNRFRLSDLCEVICSINGPYSHKYLNTPFSYCNSIDSERMGQERMEAEDAVVLLASTRRLLRPLTKEVHALLPALTRGLFHCNACSSCLLAPMIN
jgi:hypothetical protein